MANSMTYVGRRDDGSYWIKGTRVSPDSVVYRFLEGLSPESVQADPIVWKPVKSICR